MFFEPFHRRIRGLPVKSSAFIYHWACLTVSNLSFLQTFSSKVSRCNQESWRTNSSSLMRTMEACLTSTSPLWGGRSFSQNNADLYSFLKASQLKPRGERLKWLTCFFSLAAIKTSDTSSCANHGRGTPMRVAVRTMWNEGNHCQFMWGRFCTGVLTVF